VSRKWSNWYQNEVDEEIKRVGSRAQFQRHSEGKQKKQSVIFRVDDEGC